jgi:hypothetical protein
MDYVNLIKEDMCFDGNAFESQAAERTEKKEVLKGFCCTHYFSLSSTLLNKAPHERTGQGSRSYPAK